MGKFLFFVFLATSVNAQYVIRDAEELRDLEKLPQEKVYVNHTGPMVFAGEYLHYAFYCFNAQSNRLSNISYVGYVALVNEDREYVLEQKIKLENGLSQGDFFITTDIPSGNYKLLGYTQWMKNNGLEQVFKDDLVIINPYQVDQRKLMDNETATPSIGLENPMDTSIIQLKFEKKLFSKREKVVFIIRNYKERLGYGNYTIKVQRKSEIPVRAAMNAIKFGEDYFNVPNRIEKTVGDSLYLPEQRGELMYGHIEDRFTGKAIGNATVVISVPGEEFLLKFATTDQEGNFYSYLRKEYKEPTAIVQLKEARENTRIQLKPLEKLDVSQLTFDHLSLNPTYAGAIEQRSIHNQLENQFFSVKPDSVLLGLPVDPFDGGLPETFRLDDYTRFSTFEETLVEIMNYVGYRKNGKGKDYIRVSQDLETYNEKYNDFPAIVLIDGVFVPNHEKIREFDARRIETIDLIRDQFRLAGEEYQGMLVIKTQDGDFYRTFVPEHGINVPINKPLTKKNYYRQKYGDNNSFDRIPDYRELLLWEPHLEVDGNNVELEFFTSDLTGEFEVTLDGFTSYGKPISLSKTIGVREQSD